MTAIGYYAGRLPGVPSMRERAKKRIHRALEQIRGDADVVGLVRTNDGWDFVPGDIVDEGDEQFVVPTDPQHRPYPADGIPDTPPTLFDVPVTIGYRDFGCLNEVPNVNFIAETVSVGELVRQQASQPARDETDDEGDNPGEDDDSNAIFDAFTQLRERIGAWRQRRRLSTGWSWLQRDAETLILEQDGDAALSIERADYDLQGDGPEWYVTRKTDYYFDARGHGAAPQTVEGADLGLGYSPIPKLLAPVACRIARNMQAQKLTTAAATQQAGQRRVAADGGIRHNDIIVEERAMVWPADIQMLGAPEETQEKIKTAERQTLAKENPPGGLEFLGTMGKIGVILVMFAVGAQVGDPSGVIQIIQSFFGGFAGAV